MTEKEFDQRIRERAALRENESGQPLWNKEDAWSRIEAGVNSNNKKIIWWPAAAVFLLFLFTAGFSVAQYLNNEKYKEQKELEIQQLKETIESVESQSNLLRENLQKEIKRKDEQLESLKNDISLKEENAVEIELSNEELQLTRNEVKILKNDIIEKDETISLLRNEILFLKEEKQEVSTVADDMFEDTMTMQVAEPEIDKSSTRVYNLNSSPQEMRTPNRNKIKINLFGREGDNVEYKANQSIFSK